MLCLSLVLLLLQLVEVAGQGGAVYACEGDMLQFACQTGVVLVKSAKYGRPAGRTFRCGESQNLHKGCIADVTQYVKYRCDNHPMCEIYVDVATFMMEMCPDILKYVDVTYDCVSPRTVESVTSCQMQCLPGGSPYGGNNINGGNRYSGVPAATPAGGRPPASGPRTPAHAPAPAPAAVPSPARPPSTSHSHSASQGTPAPAPAALPYSGPNVSPNFAARLASIQAQAQRAAALLRSSQTSSPKTGTSPTGSTGTSGTGQSATSGSSQSGTSGTAQTGTSRAALLARMQTMLAALRARKAAQQAPTQG